MGKHQRTHHRGRLGTRKGALHHQTSTRGNHNVHEITRKTRPSKGPVTPHTHKLKEIEEIFATLRRDQWDKQLNHHARTWSFKGFPKHFSDIVKKDFMFKMVGYCAEWALHNGRGRMHLAAVTSSGLEGNTQTNSKQAKHRENRDKTFQASTSRALKKQNYSGNLYPKLPMGNTG